MNIKKISLFAFVVFFVSSGLYAQEPVAKQEDKPKGISYLRFELAHEEARVEGRVLEASSLGFGIDNYFIQNHWGLSGYTVTYKKYLNYTAETGHFLGGKLFREFNPELSYLKPKVAFNLGAGFEWGNASGLYDRTLYSEDLNGNLAYKHLFESRNSNIPYVKPHHDAVWHTLVEAGVVKKSGEIIFQAGIRANLINFGVDEYRLNGNNLVFRSADKMVVVPSLFISFGFKM